VGLGRVEGACDGGLADRGHAGILALIVCCTDKGATKDIKGLVAGCRDRAGRSGYTAELFCRLTTFVKVSSTTSGSVMVAVSALLFACKGTLIKYIYTLGGGVADVMVLRLAFSMPVYVWIARRHWSRGEIRLSGREWLGLIGCGISGYYLASYFDMLGLQTISVGLERVIVYTYPAFVVLFGLWLFKRPLSFRLVACIALAYVGLFLVFYSDISLQPASSIGATIRGSLWVLVSAIAYAVYIVGAERYMRAMSSALFTAVAMFAAGGVMLLHYLVFESPAALLNLSPAVYGWCLLLAMAFTVAPALLMSAGVRRIGSAKSAGIGMVGPLATLVIAALVLDETVTVLQVTGFLIVMFAIHRLHKA
jgi:drug/metabolite transporter (DMT)-like permease